MMTTRTETTLEKLKLSRGGWLINRLDLNYSRRQLEVSAEFEDRPIHLVFTDFHLVSWQIMNDERDPGTINIDVIGMELGENAHHKPAIITTDLFEIIVTYDDLMIEKAW